MGSTPRWPSALDGPARWQGRGQDGGVGIGFAQQVTIHQAKAAAGSAAAGSAYLRQVERIAPPRLLGREAELAALAAFCTQDDRSPYVWWRAGPWAGKSALLSTFVLDPPEPLRAARVRLVSFFITARLAAQDTREAFTTTLTQQLCALTGQELPAALGEARREGVLLDLLGQAARACEDDGGRLVLIIDGLDEDRGVMTGPDAHSIAGLLPGKPSAGLRVIVAGRPNPPIPDDVAGWHPLRDPGIIRLLGDSPHARDLQRHGQSELKRLLAGTEVEQSLLGLLAAARGGLTGDDLRALTGADLVTIEEVLHTVTGRTFTRRRPYWSDDSRLDHYLLGHEELQNAAVHYLGRQRLAVHRAQLHAWADSHRSPSDGSPPWPPATPEYLLSGYPRMLAAAGEVDRLVTLATDRIRHDRMFALSGGDAAALSEIRTCAELVVGAPSPDLVSLARLAVHRQYLEARNANIPVEFPAVWAALGQPTRGAALALGISEANRRAEALYLVVAATAMAGAIDRAAEIAGAIGDPVQRTRALVAVSEADGTGETGRIERLFNEAAGAAASIITVASHRSKALAGLAGAMAQALSYDQAQKIVAQLPDEHERAASSTELACAVVRSLDYDRAERLIGDLSAPLLRELGYLALAPAMVKAGEYVRAERLARAITNADRCSGALVDMMRAMPAECDVRIIRHWASAAATRMREIPLFLRRASLSVRLAQTLVTFGEYDHAEQLVRDHALDVWLNDEGLTMAGLAVIAAAAGQSQHARRLAADAETSIRALDDPEVRMRALVSLASAVALAGEPDRAERIARAITAAEIRAEPFLTLVRVLARDARYEGAGRLAGELAGTGQHGPALLDLVTALVHAGELTSAERIARDIAEFPLRVQAVLHVATALHRSGEASRSALLITDVKRALTETGSRSVLARLLAALIAPAAALGDRAWLARLTETATRAIRDNPNPSRVAQELAGLTVVLAEIGEQARSLAEEAERIANAIDDPYPRALALAALARAFAGMGFSARAAASSSEARRAAVLITVPSLRTEALTDLVEALTDGGELDRAEETADLIGDPQRQAEALMTIADAAGAATAHRLLGRALVVGSWTAAIALLAKLHPALVLQIEGEIHSVLTDRSL